MRPGQLTQKEFSGYPPQAKRLAIDHLATLRLVPLSLLPTLLRDIGEYDWKFPPEQAEIQARLQFLEGNPSALSGLEKIAVPDGLAKIPWFNEPRRFIELFTAYLWSSNQIDAYRIAAEEFVSRFNRIYRPPHPSIPRLVMVVIGRDAKKEYPLFQKLGPHGLILSQVSPESAAATVLHELQGHAQKAPGDYANWYIDGGNPMVESAVPGVTQLSYPALAPVNQRILGHVTAAIQSGSGPEVLRTVLARLSPKDVLADKVTDDPRMQRFAISLLTEGSGTQIFSTSFVQWAAREALRRAQPATLLVRFAPRQREQAFNAMVHAASGAAELDAEGSLIDADMGAYYTYLEMKRLPGSEEATFLVWVEGRTQAFLSGPGIVPGTRSDRRASLAEQLKYLAA